MRIVAILCVDRQFGIARHGQIPWDLPEEYAHFVATVLATPNAAMVMGKATWRQESAASQQQFLRRLRQMFVLSSSLSGESPKVCASLPAAVAQARALGVDTLFIAGGAGVYREAIQSGLVEEILLSRLAEDYGCTLTLPWLATTLATDFGRAWKEARGRYRLECWRRVGSSSWIPANPTRE